MPSPPPHNQAINGDVEVALKQKKKQPKIAKQSLVEERNLSIRRPTSVGKKVSQSLLNEGHFRLIPQLFTSFLSFFGLQASAYGTLEVPFLSTAPH